MLGVLREICKNVAVNTRKIHVPLHTAAVRRYKCDVMATTPWLLCEKMTSSTKPEVHSESQRHQRRTERRPWATCKNGGSSAVWFSSFASGQTDRQTDILISILRTPPGGEVIRLHNAYMLEHSTTNVLSSLLVQSILVTGRSVGLFQVTDSGVARQGIMCMAPPHVVPVRDNFLCKS